MAFRLDGTGDMYVIRVFDATVLDGETAAKYFLVRVNIDDSQIFPRGDYPLSIFMRISGALMIQNERPRQLDFPCPYLLLDMGLGFLLKPNSRSNTDSIRK